MKAVVIKSHGGIEGLDWTDVADVVPTSLELLVRVRAAGVNRADILQRQGFYPPPPGESEIPGLEIAGDVVAMGEETKGFQVGDRIFGLVAGGGYGEFCPIHYRMAMPLPTDWSYSQGAAVTEVFYTAGETLFTHGGLREGEDVLIHAGGSGVGSAGIQLATRAGARVYVTAGSQAKIDRCMALGAVAGFNYKQEDFVAGIQRETAGAGVHQVLDFIGGAYLNRNLQVLRPMGRLVVVGLLGGRKAELDLGLILTRRLRIIGSVMRSLSLEEKRAIKQRFMKRWMPGFEENGLQPIIYAEVPVENVREAHKIMEENLHFGKIVLIM